MLVLQAIVGRHPIGPYNLLGWGFSTPLTLEVARQLEQQQQQQPQPQAQAQEARRGYCTVTFLVNGDVAHVQRWAGEQNDQSLLRAIFTDDKSQEVGQLSVVSFRSQSQSHMRRWQCSAEF